MTYYTGSATTHGDLLTAINSAAVTEGWVQDAFSGGYLHLHSGAAYIHYYGDSGSSIYCMSSSDYVPGQNLTGHANSQLYNTVTDYFPGPFSEYHLFVTSSYIHVVALTSNGYWRHLHCGLMDTSGTISSAVYTQAHNYPTNNFSPLLTASNDWNCVPFSSSQLYAIYQSQSGNRVLVYDGSSYIDTYMGYSANVSYGNRCSSKYFSKLLTRSPNVFNQQTILNPLLPSYEKTYNTGVYTPLGSFKDVRGIFMSNFRGGDIMTLGSDQWMLFPMATQTIGSQVNPYDPYTSDYGYAFLKNP